MSSSFLDSNLQATNHTDSQFEAVRGRLFGLAYRMLGVRADAEDIVQETYVRWHEADRTAIRSAEAWLVTTATRLCIDRLRALKVERAAYEGPWMPEPLVSELPPPDRAVEQASDLSVAFLVLLERLGPEERAAFLLHDVFDQPYVEIAAILDKSEAACRQMVRRARERVRRGDRRFTATASDKVRLLQQFTAAVAARDEKALQALFAPDAVWTADGGGRAPAAPRPIVGAARIAKLVLGIQTRTFRNQLTLHLVDVNGEPGLCARLGDTVVGVVAIESDGTRIRAAHVIVNPEKLTLVPALS
jgi:RNA polymerase sigma-70 factor (ECF subfamily)